MKTQMLNILYVAMCSVVISGCGKTNDPVVGPGNGGSSQGRALELSPFAMLNQGASAINSHADIAAQSSLMMDHSSYIEIGQGVTGVGCPIYPRIKKMANGEYILFYQNNQIGADSYYIVSPDLLSWSGGQRVFSRHAITDSSGATNERRFSTCDALVLSNGDIIAVASYRANKNYSILPLDNGLIMSRSADNGGTWSTPQEIYQGTNWEPFLMQLPSGEIHCYFSDCRPNITSNNSGTSLIVSNDNGQTWTPTFGDSPYKVMRKKRGTQDTHTLYTDQMPTTVKLNGSRRIAAALEDYDGQNYHISFAYSCDNGEWQHLVGDEEGPADRVDHAFRGCAPYMSQFPSGETILSYNEGGYFHLKVGDATASNFGDALLPFPNKKGFWGVVQQVDSHQIVGSIPNTTTSGGVTTSVLMLARFALNHGITATNRTIKQDGYSSEWTNTDEALFVGQKSQAQASLRCSQDENNIYFLIEVHDNAISQDDNVTIYLSPATPTNNLNSDGRRIKVSHSGLISAYAYAGGWKEKDMSVVVHAAYDGTISKNDDIDSGYLVEITVPRSELKIESGTILVNFALFDTQGGEDSIDDTSSKSVAKWIPISGL